MIFPSCELLPSEPIDHGVIPWVAKSSLKCSTIKTKRKCKRNRLRVKARKRAAKFEDKMDGREECRILTECLREKKNTEKKEREKRVYKQERKEKIKESRYNKKWERCMTEEVPEYLGRENARERKDVGTRREKTGIGWKERKEGILSTLHSAYADARRKTGRDPNVCASDQPKPFFYQIDSNLPWNTPERSQHLFTSMNALKERKSFFLAV
ncbi:hypothetical protein GEV33_014276 [Tenebrio molitor]|uniref:Uncharacterized protein n=1 Tax=Tenebrio molitor TaxID=7067 RepID=A0A8J6H5K9_TENMO|nr:hypothetical protein GEV33_014276 [Tenebrio molitor]